jgi:GGDEF domain-containing protein
MDKLKIWLIGLLLWLFFIYNIERFSEPINLASFVYVFMIICALAIILLPRLQRMPFYLPTLLALPIFFLLKTIFGYEIAGKNLPITITEICSIGITIFLTEQVWRGMDRLNKVVSNLTIGELNKGSYHFEIGQGQIYREIRRARHYKRPAALLSISVSEKSLNLALEKLVQDAQQRIIQDYVAARIAKFLVEELQDTDVVAQRDDHFITLLPETTRDDVSDIVKRLQSSARQKLGLDLKIGKSTFPDQAVTFERLLEQAEEDMANSSIRAVKQMGVAPAETESVLQIR